MSAIEKGDRRMRDVGPFETIPWSLSGIAVMATEACWRIEIGIRNAWQWSMKKRRDRVKKRKRTC